MKNILYIITLAILLISCTGELPPEPIRDSPYDGRNPDAEPEVLGLTIDNQNGFTNDTNLNVRVSTKGSIEIKLGEVNAQNEPLTASWQANSVTIYHLRISNIDGEKWIGCQAKALNGRESEVKYASVKLDIRAEIASFDWQGSGGDTLGLGDQLTFTLQAANDAFGVETGGSAEVSVEGWDPIILTEQGDGRYASTITLTADYTDVFNARVSAIFEDRLDNRSASVVSNGSINIDILLAGKERTFPLGDSGADIVMVWIPTGSFQMGSPDGEADRDSDEGPVHTVIIGDGFWLGKFEVTQDQWEAVMNDNPSRFNGANRPVEQVSWNDIQGFESALDNAFRLPSESEWEYACRAGTDTRFYWGTGANYNDIDRYAIHSVNDPVGTAEIGTKFSNAWGLFDMSGNVWEFCEDWHHSNYNNAPNDGSAWISPSGSNRIRRGGSWDNGSECLRSADRDRFALGYAFYSVGFRLARDAG